jgi:CBS domain-containing protein
LLTCFPDTDLTTAKNLMEARGIKQLPVVKRGVGHRTEGKRKLIALLYYDSIGHCLQSVHLCAVLFSINIICFVSPLSIIYSTYSN